MPERLAGALGDEVGVQLRVVPEVAPFRPELLVARDRQAREARRRGVVLDEGPVESHDELEIVGHSGPDPDVGADRFHRRGLPHGQDGLDAEGEPQPGIGERFVAGRDEGNVARGAGRNPARGKRRIQVADRVALARRRRAAGEVDDSALVAEQWILLDPADHVGDQVVPAERDHAARRLMS